VTDLTAAPAPPAIAEGFSDQALREALASPDWQTRERAQQEWSSRFQAAYGDTVPEPPAPSSGGGGQQRQPMVGDVDSDVPPSAENYSLHPVLNAAPEFAEAFRDWCHAAGFGVADAAALGGEVVRLSEAERDPPEHVRQSKSDSVLADLGGTDEGRQVLHFAKLGWPSSSTTWAPAATLRSSGS
jgi:hypothetical protein